MAAHQALSSLGFSRQEHTGVGCHFLLQCMKVKSESEVAQSCSTPSDPMDCSLPGSSVHGICQARVLEWGAIAFSDSWLYFTFIPLNSNNMLIEMMRFIGRESVWFSLHHPCSPHDWHIVSSHGVQETIGGWKTALIFRKFFLRLSWIWTFPFETPNCCFLFSLQQPEKTADFHFSL